jgi:hypothetical protein
MATAASLVAWRISPRPSKNFKNARHSEEFAKLDVVRNDIGGLLANLRDSLKVKATA